MRLGGTARLFMDLIMYCQGKGCAGYSISYPLRGRPHLDYDQEPPCLPRGTTMSALGTTMSTLGTTMSPQRNHHVYTGNHHVSTEEPPCLHRGTTMSPQRNHHVYTGNHHVYTGNQHVPTEEPPCLYWEPPCLHRGTTMSPQRNHHVCIGNHHVSPQKNQDIATEKLTGHFFKEISKYSGQVCSTVKRYTGREQGK